MCQDVVHFIVEQLRCIVVDIVILVLMYRPDGVECVAVGRVVPSIVAKESYKLNVLRLIV